MAIKLWYSDKSELNPVEVTRWTCDHVGHAQAMVPMFCLLLGNSHKYVLISDILKDEKMNILEWMNYENSYSLLRIHYITSKVLNSWQNLRSSEPYTKKYVHIIQLHQVNVIVPDSPAR
jgi:hypothetical protein